jgi:hypothetical protein
MSPSVEIGSSFEAPDFGLIASGVYRPANANSCDSTAIEELGYGPVRDAKVAAGTIYPFYAPINILDDPAREFSVFVVGEPQSEGGAMFFEPAVIAAAPAL